MPEYVLVGLRTVWDIIERYSQRLVRAYQSPAGEWNQHRYSALPNCMTKLFVQCSVLA